MLRLGRGMTVEELAEAAAIERHFIELTERGAYAPPGHELAALAGALKVAPEALGGDPPIEALIGRNIRYLRRMRRIARAALATRLGISDRQLQRHEMGRIPMEADLLIAIAGQLGVTLAALFRDDWRGAQRGNRITGHARR